VGLQADLGRWLALWSDAARAQEATQRSEWINRTWPQVKLMAGYIRALRTNATKAVGVGKGLIFGPAEFDECMFQQRWFSISAWAWRGLLQLQRFLSDTNVLAQERQFAVSESTDYNSAPLFQNGDKTHDLRCVLHPAGFKTPA
jgi:hypothetical protein